MSASSVSRFLGPHCSHCTLHADYRFLSRGQKLLGSDFSTVELLGNDAFTAHIAVRIQQSLECIIGNLTIRIHFAFYFLHQTGKQQYNNLFQHY